jgi:hypothetical protein
LERVVADLDNPIALLHARVAALDKSKAALTLAQIDFNRAKQLLGIPAESREEYDRAQKALSAGYRAGNPQLAGPFGSRAMGIGEPVAQGTAVLASIVRREAFVLAYIDAVWLIAWVSLFGILLVLLRPPPPNPLIPSRGAS